MRLSHLQCFWFRNFSKIWIPLIISKCNLKRRIRSAVLCSDFVYILLLTTYARLLCILLKSLSIVILEFDDKFSQSSRFCWGSNFSLSLNLEPHSYLVPDFKNKIDLSPDISGIARYLSPPFCRGSFGGYTEGFLFTGPDWRLFQGLGGGYFGQRKKWPWAGTRD